MNLLIKYTPYLMGISLLLILMTLLFQATPAPVNATSPHGPAVTLTSGLGLETDSTDPIGSATGAPRSDEGQPRSEGQPEAAATTPLPPSGVQGAADSNACIATWHECAAPGDTTICILTDLCANYTKTRTTCPGICGGPNTCYRCDLIAPTDSH